MLAGVTRAGCAPTTPSPAGGTTAPGRSTRRQARSPLCPSTALTRVGSAPTAPLTVGANPATAVRHLRPTGVLPPYPLVGIIRARSTPPGPSACWGFNWYSQLRPPEGTFTTLDVHSPACALGTDGTLACWGIWEHPWDHSPRPDGTFIAVDIDTKHGCAIRTDGTVACWGTPGGVSEPPPGTFTAITSGDYYSCGLRTDNTIACWGDNDQGQADAPSGTFTAITSGAHHSCGLRTNSAITCWGTNDHGQAPRSA